MSIDNEYSIHDFPVVLGDKITNLIFDVCVPVNSNISDSDITKRISEYFKAIDPKYCVVVTVDRNYVNRS